MVTASVVNERVRMWYGPIFRRSNYEYELVTAWSVAVTAIGEPSATTH